LRAFARAESFGTIVFTRHADRNSFGRHERPQENALKLGLTTTSRGVTTPIFVPSGSKDAARANDNVCVLRLERSAEKPRSDEAAADSTLPEVNEPRQPRKMSERPREHAAVSSQRTVDGGPQSTVRRKAKTGPKNERPARSPAAHAAPATEPDREASRTRQPRVEAQSDAPKRERKKRPRPKD
jgi:hypothetical protein